MSDNRVGDAIRLIDLAPSGEFRSDLRAKLLAGFALQDAGSGVAADVAAPPSPDPGNDYVKLAPSLSPRDPKRRMAKTILAAAACLAVVVTGVVIAHRGTQINKSGALRDVDRPRALPLARRGLIADQALGVTWLDSQVWGDNDLPKQAAATIAVMPDCASLISVGLFPPSTKAATAYQYRPDGNLLAQRVFVFASADDASRAMDFIDGDGFAPCWFDLFDRVTPLAGAGRTSTSVPWNAPAISRHGDRQVIIGQQATVVSLSGTTELHLVNAFVQVGRSITWIDPRLLVSGDLFGVEKTITAAATALKTAGP